MLLPFRNSGEGDAGEPLLRLHPCNCITKLLLSLSFKLWIFNLNRYDCCKTFSYIIT